MKRVLMIVLAMAAVAALSVSAFAQQPVEYKVTVQAEAVKGAPGDHFLTFTEAVNIPDATLPAGTYVFRMIGSSVVQVTTADRTEPVAMFFTSPISRIEPSAAYEVTLEASGKGEPRRIAAWFLPNNDVGREFLYSPRETAGER